ncbi:hypothetical protein HS088_TW12G00344 [Tripterygium wilfordii]|uniref:Helicase ATP-binding domain-containing protein n=1 Tax=Tripterygium wilfordii TaxID=458696 RepID=A0A7J7CYJ4_TRIWF|nr:hypothetical protein HS088_TW12G00344 [Tripterygium wilfordii]
MGQEEGGSKFAGFPYKPYSIQVDFMNALYQSLDKGGVSMLESPTGTGKTLSIICSAFQWVLDQRRKENLQIRDDSVANQKSEGQVGCDDEPAWLRNFDVNKSNQPPEKKINEKKDVCQSKKKGKGSNQESYRDLFARGEEECSPMDKLSEKLQKKNDAEELSDDEFLLEEYESDEERALGGGKSKRKPGGISICSSSDEEREEDGTNEKEEDEGRMKVYFCSRTHSQLSQFIQELRKTVFANEINVVCLGSRKNLCINEEVLKLGNSTRINERCLDLRKNKKNETSKIKNVGADGRRHRTKASSGCPMLRKHQLQRQFRSEASHNGALDIEDLIQLGRSLGTCPYYASRSMVLGADLVVLPYQSLLSKSSRESLGLNLKNNIVIIDEAHNLADSLISMYDAKITLSQLETVHLHIEKYFGRFRNLLGPGNRRHIQTLMVITRALLQSLLEKDMDYVDTCKDAEKAAGSINAFDSSMAINDFLFSLNIDNINMIKLVQYIKESNIIHKISGYGDKVSRLNEGLALKDSWESYEEESSLAGFQALVDMLLSLINKDSDGRIIISRARPTCFGQKGGYLKYVMLTGEKIFSEIAGQAHAVILAGGTLQPIEETRERLFPWLPLSELHFFSCNHIVPPENIMPVAVSYGPTGRSFDFSYNSRSLPTVRS